MSTTDWRDATYEETFERTFGNLQHRRESDSSFTLQEAEGTLNALYVMDGNDWLGRGGVGDAELSAQIAAHEAFIHKWKAELPGGEGLPTRFQ